MNLHVNFLEVPHWTPKPQIVGLRPKSRDRQNSGLSKNSHLTNLPGPKALTKAKDNHGEIDFAGIGFSRWSLSPCCSSRWSAVSLTG
jgi:hypothetical protein